MRRRRRRRRRIKASQDGRMRMRRRIKVSLDENGDVLTFSILVRTNLRILLTDWLVCLTFLQPEVTRAQKNIVLVESS